LAGPRVFTFVFSFSLTGFAAAPPSNVMNLRRFIIRNFPLASFGLELSDSFGRFPNSQ